MPTTLPVRAMRTVEQDGCVEVNCMRFFVGRKWLGELVRPLRYEREGLRESYVIQMPDGSEYSAPRIVGPDALRRLANRLKNEPGNSAKVSDLRK